MNTNESPCESKNSNINCKPLVVNHTEYMTLYTKKFENRKAWKKPDPNHIVSFIPGTIKKIYVSDGQTVKKDDPILILEAMKMENTFFAPFDAKIVALHVKENQTLPKGFLMVELKS